MCFSMLSSVDEDDTFKHEYVCDSDDDDDEELFHPKAFQAQPKPSLRRRGAVQREKSGKRRSSVPESQNLESVGSRKSLIQIGRGQSQMQEDLALPISRNSTRLLSFRDESDSFSLYLVKDNASLIRYLDELPPERSLQLVNQRLDVEVEGVYDRFTPLGYAISENDSDMVLALLSHGADVNGKPNVLRYDENKHLSEIESPLHFAALFSCKPSIIDHLVDFGADLEDASPTAHLAVIRYLSGCQDKDIIKKLVDVLAIDDYHERNLVTALHLSTTNENEEAVEVLLKEDFDINAQHVCKTALLLACKTNNEKILGLLLQTGSNVNACDIWSRTPLHFAVKHCSRQNIKLLLDAGADVNAQDRNSRNILNYIFARTGNKLLSKRTEEESGVIVGLLFEASEANITIRNPAEFLEALHAVLSSNIDEQLIIKFIAKNSTYMMPDHRGELFLHTAIQHRKKTVMEWLLKKVSSIHDCDLDRGWAAIHHAVATKEPEMIETVLNHGGDINAAAKHGITPLCLMIRLGLFSLAEEHINKGCSVDGTVRLSGFLLIPCSENDPHLPLELYNPNETQDGRTQARRNKRQLTLVEIALHMDQYKLAYLLFEAGAPLEPPEKPLQKNDSLRPHQTLHTVYDLIQQKLKNVPTHPADRDQYECLQKLSRCLNNYSFASSTNGNGLAAGIQKLDLNYNQAQHSSFA